MDNIMKADVDEEEIAPYMEEIRSEEHTSELQSPA